MGIYDRAKASALRIIAAKGQACKWVKAEVDAVGGDPWMPTPAGEPAQFDVAIAWFSPKDLGKGAGEFIEAVKGTEIKTGIEVGLMAAYPAFTPKVGDHVLRGTQVSPIEAIDRLAPNGDAILYWVTVKL